MKLLFVSTDINPFALPTNGDAQRTRKLLEACAKVSSVDVVTFQNGAISDIDNVHVAYSGETPCVQPRASKLVKWISACGNAEAMFPVNHERKRILNDIIEHGQYDLIVSRYFLRSVPCGLLEYIDRLIVDFDDDLPFFFLSQIKPSSSMSHRLRMKLSAINARRLTFDAVRKLRGAFFSQKDAAVKYHGTHLPNIPYYADTCSNADFSVPLRRLLFVGQLSYPPNRDGLDHFLEYIYKPLTERIPSIEFHIVGQLPDHKTAERWHSYHGVTLTGFVDDLHAEYQACHAVVAPVYQCGGTNIKLLEALQMNRACITTAAALLHLQPTFENHRDIIGANSDYEFIEMLAKMLSRPEDNISLAHNGHAKMQQYYSFNTFATIVANTLICH